MSERGPALDELSSERERPDRTTPGRRAWVWRGSALVAVVAVAAAFGPGLVASSDDAERRQPPEPSASSQPSASPTPTRNAPSALRWTVRGDLADDNGFAASALAAVQRLEPTAEKVLYAGTLPDSSRLAFVAVNDPSYSGGLAFRSTGVLALHVPADAPVRRGRVSDASGISSADDMTGWAGHVRGGSVVAVLLARPVPLDAQVSAAIHYERDGSARRAWRVVSGRDGSAIVDLGADVDPLVVARTRYTESVSYPLLLTVGGDLSDQQRDQVAVDVGISGLGDSYRGPEPAALRQAVVNGSWPLLDPRRARTRVLWSGELGSGHRGALLLLRRPDGPMFQLFVSETVDGVFPQGLRHVAWGDAGVLPWVLQSGQPGRLLLRLVNPSGAGEVVVTPEGTGPRRFEIGADGVANLGEGEALTARTVAGAAVTIFSPSGRVVVRTTLSGQDHDPFALRSP